MEDLFKKGILFLRKIKPTDKILLVYHKDLDGLASGVIFSRIMKKLNLRVSKKFASSNEEIEKIRKCAKKFDKIIVLDVDISYMKKELVKMKKDILIVDHHPPKINLNTKRIVYINPRLKNPKIYQPTSYITYKFFSRICRLKNEKWLAVLGTISDFGFADCKDLLKELRIKKKEDILKTRSWKEVEKIIGTISEIGFRKTFELMEKANTLKEFKKNKIVKKALKNYFKKIKECEEIFWKNLKEYKEANLLISEIKTKHREITSLISTKMSGKFSEKVLVVLRKVGKKYAVHARYNGSVEINLGKIMEKCAKGLNGGGGHPNAAGASIKEKNKKIFEKRLIEELSRFFNKK
ncbi:MAG: DHHA1 domain-containing protein [Candidatus Aenigmarchaeota archaeon]|nr:DHHA1 domain-containing protein [Candidatus Aenigmarchaeota archaeon]